MATQLRALANIILSNIDTLEAGYSKHKIPFPSLDEPFMPSSLDGDTAILDTSQLIIAAATQIMVTVRQPFETVENYSLGMYMTATLGFVVDANIADILQEAGPQGLPVKDIAVKARIDTTRLTRILRYLAARHVFREVSPNVFGNNRISSIIATKGKTLKEIKANPASRFDGSGISAYVGHLADEALKSSASFSSFVINPEGKISPFSMSMEAQSVWEWYKKPENALRNQRFTEAMKNGSTLFAPEIFTTAINWSELKADSVVVDIGGSLGTVTLILVKAFPDLRYTIQDLEIVVPETKKFWTATFPEAVANDRVKIQAYDFFTPQPIKAAAVYFLRFILHDWPDADNIKILKHIRAVAAPDSKLIIWDILIHHACRIPLERVVPGSPALIPMGLGWSTEIDMHMLNMFDAQERTLEEFRVIGEAAGWKLDKFKSGRNLTAFIFVPA